MRTEEKLIKVITFIDTNMSCVTREFIQEQPNGIYAHQMLGGNYMIWLKDGDSIFYMPICIENPTPVIEKDTPENNENTPEPKQIRRGGWIDSKTLLEIIKVLSGNKTDSDK